MSTTPIEEMVWTVTIGGAGVSVIAAIADREGCTRGYAMVKSIGIYAALAARIADGATILVREADGTEYEVQSLWRDF